MCEVTYMYCVSLSGQSLKPVWLLYLKYYYTRLSCEKKKFKNVKDTLLCRTLPWCLRWKASLVEPRWGPFGAVTFPVQKKPTECIAPQSTSAGAFFLQATSSRAGPHAYRMYRS